MGFVLRLRYHFIRRRDLASLPSLIFLGIWDEIEFQKSLQRVSKLVLIVHVCFDCDVDFSNLSSVGLSTGCRHMIWI